MIRIRTSSSSRSISSSKIKKFGETTNDLVYLDFMDLKKSFTRTKPISNIWDSKSYKDSISDPEKVLMFKITKFNNKR